MFNAINFSGDPISQTELEKSITNSKRQPLTEGEMYRYFEFDEYDDYVKIRSAGGRFKLPATVVFPSEFKGKQLFLPDNCSNLFGLRFNVYYPDVKTQENIEYIDLSNIKDTSNIEYMHYMFFDCEKLQNIILTNLNTSNVVDMSYMFGGCENLQSIDLLGFDTSNVKAMNGMFLHCESIYNLDVSSFDTFNVTNMELMFKGCKNLQNLDISNFDMLHVTDMDYMFLGCKNLQNLNMPDLDETIIESASYVFDGCDLLKPVKAKEVQDNNNLEYILDTDR